MPHFNVSGKMRETGKQQRLKVEARDAQHATDRATRHGMDVASVEIVDTGTAVVAAPEPAPIAPVRASPPPVVSTPYAQPVAQHVHFHEGSTPKGTSGLGIAALVLGIVACLVAWVPFLGMLAIPVAGIGVVLAVIGFLISLIGSKSGVGMPVAGAIACIVAMVIVVISTGGTTAAISGAVTQAQQTAAARANAMTATGGASMTPAAPPPADVNVDPAMVPQPLPDGSIKIGDTIVKMIGVRVAKIPLLDIGGDRTTSADELLAIGVSIVNRSAAKRLEYDSWRGDRYGFGRNVATLTDEHGNTYKRIRFNLGTKIEASPADAFTVDPGREGTDMLIFERPIAQATTLTLELPGDNIGKRGATLKFELKAPK